MANIIPIKNDTLSSDFFNDINKNFESLNEETKYKFITDRDIMYGAVTNPKIKDGAVTTSKLAANSVTTSKLAANSVTTSKIADGTIQEKDLSEELQVKLNNTKRIFVVNSIPIGSTITDINNQTITARTGDIIVLVKGNNG